MTRPRDQGTPEWHAERRTGYGASDAPTLVLGDEADWRQLHGEKLGILPPREATETMDLGKRLEGVILKAAAERSGPIIRVPRIVRHPDLPYVFASLDGRRKRGDRRPVEIKKWGWKGDDWGPAGSDTVPVRILYQVQQQAAVTGADAVDVVVLFGGSSIEEFTVGRDESIIAELLGLETAAWAYILEGQMPPYPGEQPKRIVLAHDEVALDDVEALAGLVEEYERDAAGVAEWKERLDDDKNIMREMLADAGGAKGVLPDGRRVTISHRPQEPRTTVAWELVAKAYREMLLTPESGQVVPRTPESLDAIESMFTSTAAPIRPLRVTIGKGTQ